MKKESIHKEREKLETPEDFSQLKNVKDPSEDEFDWDWIFDREWLRTKK